MDDALERALHLARRELGAGDVHVLPVTEQPPTAANVVSVRLPDGRSVVATFDAPPDAPDAIARRLEMLLGSFAGAMDASSPASRPPLRVSLHDELRALAQRANASDAAIVDIDSPVLWGSASTPARPRLAPVRLPEADGPVRLESSPALAASAGPPNLSSNDGPDGPSNAAPVPAESARELRGLRDTRDLGVPAPEMSGQLPTADDDPIPAATLRALGRVRALDDLAQVKRGRALRKAFVEGDEGTLVLSFSGIYLLVLVYDGEFDELRGERAAHEALPRIESLVSALPPIEPDPQPMGAVVAFRRGRRR